VVANDSQENARYGANRISNTKYTVLTFLPLNLRDQFGYVVISLMSKIQTFVCERGRLGILSYHDSSLSQIMAVTLEFQLEFGRSQKGVSTILLKQRSIGDIPSTIILQNQNIQHL
jgi:hypothetical protein